MDRSTSEVKVWDLFVRVFHWSLVIGFTIAYVTGEDETPLHEWIGYAVLVLVITRMLWGFVGSKHARFDDFVRGPRAIASYTADMLRGRAARYLGHNPLGGIMIVVMLVSLLATTLSGWAALRTEPPHRAAGERAHYARASDSQTADDPRSANHEVFEETHEFFANLTLLLVFLHIGGVVVSSLSHRENLVRAMFTGRKRRQ